MKKIILFFFILFISFNGYSQIKKYPVFKDCDTIDITSLQNCFNTSVKNAVLNTFKLPELVQNDHFKGVINVVFSVDSLGSFKAIYVNSPYKELKSEFESVFAELPKVKPATYNNHPIDMQFVMPFSIPIDSIKKETTIQKIASVENDTKPLLKVASEDTKISKSLYPEHTSVLNIPFTNSMYRQYDYYLNKNSNSHTASKPYIYSDVANSVNLDSLKNSLNKPKSTWFGRKLLNEHMAVVEGKDYWITFDPMVDLQLGKDSKGGKTYNNTRAIQINGGIGSKFNFATSFYESQGKFADYVNKYIESMPPAGGNPGIIPGRGIAKPFGNGGFDYPVSEAYISYSPSEHFNFQFGNGKNFIGDGYRSLFLSDVASPYTYFKITTTFWKVRYTNLYMTAQDVRPELTVDGAYKHKYIAIHYLDWNVSKKFNLGFFESVIWQDSNGRGLDVNFLNPLIFYTSAEFSTGSRAGNTLLGFSMKYRMKNIALYSQLIIDDFRISEMTKRNGWWANKNGMQLGVKYFDAFKIKNLYLQAEYNSVRPYTYSHDELNFNYGHNDQPLAHPWGANFRELIGIASYTKDRWFANAKLVVGKKGFDFNSSTISYGGDIYKVNDYRLGDYGNKNGQGNKATILIGDLQVGYLVNPATNLKLFAGLTVRNFKINQATNAFETLNSTWISFGLKTDVFNWYFDF